MIEQTLVELTNDEFREKYTSLVEREIAPRKRLDKKGQEDYLYYGLVLHKAIKEILSPNGLMGKKVTLLDSGYCDTPEYTRPLEDIAKVAGAEVSRFERGFNEAELIKEYFRRNNSLDEQRKTSIDQSDYLFCKAERVCNVVFFPLIYNAVRDNKTALLFLNGHSLSRECANDPELKSLRELKTEGKDVHIISIDYSGLVHKFL